MSISRVGATNAASATLSSPTGLPGDIIVWSAFRSTAATIPTMPAGTTSLTAGASGSTCAWLQFYEFCTSGAASSRTATGATQLIAVRYRGVTGMGKSTNAAIASTNIMAYGAVVAIQNGGASWFLAFGAHRTATSASVNVAPTGMVIINQGSVGSAPCAAVFDTNGGATGFTAANVTASATSGRVSNVIELMAVNSTWNFYDNLNLTLSNNNLTQTDAGVPVTADNGRVGYPDQGGAKLVFKMTPNSQSMNPAIGNAASALSGFGSADSIAVYQFPPGTVNWQVAGGGGNTLGDGAGWASNTALYFAFNKITQLFWVGWDAGAGIVWNRDVSANPDTGAGGLSFAGFAGPYFPMCGATVTGDAMIYDGSLNAVIGSGLTTFQQWDILPANQNILPMFG